MPQSTLSDDEIESRTTAISLTRKERQKLEGQVQPRNPSPSPELSLSPHFPTTATIVDANDSQPATMDGISLGNNRLATGFRQPQAPAEQDLQETSPGASVEDAIEISDEDEEDEQDEEDEEDEEVEDSDDGGMVINVAPKSNNETNDMDVDQSEGHISSPPSKKDNTGSTRASSSEAPFVRRLADLNPTALSNQLKYTFYTQTHDDVDLNRSAVCLTCLRDDHNETDCPELKCSQCSGRHSSRLCPSMERCRQCRGLKHGSEPCRSTAIRDDIPCDLCGGFGHMETSCAAWYFPANPIPQDTELELWISCCKCASTGHLVGDCPRIENRGGASRWALEPLRQARVKIINRNRSHTTKRQAQEAEHRGIRPEGLTIRGRASRHTAGIPTGPRKRSAPGDSDSGSTFSDDSGVLDSLVTRGRAGDRPAKRNGLRVTNRLANGAGQPATYTKSTFSPDSPKQPTIPVPHLPTRKVLQKFLDVANERHRQQSTVQFSLEYRK
jgi:hypothetical protein